MDEASGIRALTLTDLPDDLLLQIFNDCPAKTLNDLCLTTRRFYELVTSYPELWRKLKFCVSYKNLKFASALKKLPDGQSKTFID